MVAAVAYSQPGTMVVSNTEKTADICTKIAGRVGERLTSRKLRIEVKQVPFSCNAGQRSRKSPAMKCQDGMLGSGLYDAT